MRSYRGFMGCHMACGNDVGSMEGHMGFPSIWQSFNRKTMGRAWLWWFKKGMEGTWEATRLLLSWKQHGLCQNVQIYS